MFETVVFSLLRSVNVCIRVSFSRTPPKSYGFAGGAMDAGAPCKPWQGSPMSWLVPALPLWLLVNRNVPGRLFTAVGLHAIVQLADCVGCTVIDTLVPVVPVTT